MHKCKLVNQEQRDKRLTELMNHSGHMFFKTYIYVDKIDTPVGRVNIDWHALPRVATCNFLCHFEIQVYFFPVEGLLTFCILPHSAFTCGSRFTRSKVGD